VPDVLFVISSKQADLSPLCRSSARRRAYLRKRRTPPTPSLFSSLKLATTSKQESSSSGSTRTGRLGVSSTFVLFRLFLPSLTLMLFFSQTTSSFEHEQDNFAKKKNPVNLTRELWIAKLLLGPIHSGYDLADE
jgi:hypothetical protein